MTQPHRSPRTILSITALLGLGAMTGWLGWSHQNDDEGLEASEVPEVSVADSLAHAGASALLIDFVEPADGEGGSELAIAGLAAELGAELTGFYSEGEHLYRIEGDVASLEAIRDELEADPLVEGVEPELFYAIPDDAMSAAEGLLPADSEIQKPAKPRFSPNDPMFPLQWHFEAIHVPEAWTKTRGKGATVAIIDTGVAWKDAEWKGIAAKAVPDLAGVEFTDAETFLDNAMPDGLDDHAHGTHVAGTVAQATDNGIGVSGVAYESTIMPLKVLAGDGRGSVASISNAIRYAADHGAHVINMSLGGPLPSRVMAKAVAYAHDKGVTVVCAAGNEKRSRMSYPAAYEGSVAVAATDFEGNRSFYSNWGKKLDISAPGGDTRADKNGDGHPDGVLQNTIKIQDPAHDDYLWFQGTSMASPHAAGVAALIVSSGITNPDEVERVLKETATHPNGVKWDKEFGAGIIDAEAAVSAAKQDYVPERAGLGLLGLMGLGAFGSAGGRGARSTALRVLGVAGGTALAAGAVWSPLAYVAGTTLGILGSGLLLSALVPLLLTLTGLQWTRARSLLGGMNLGWAVMLLHGAIVLPTLVTGVPGGAGWDRLFLGANALLCVWLARAVLGARAPGPDA
jgi:serine protease